MEHEIDFENGRLHCLDSQHGEEIDLVSTFDIFKRMEAYYKQDCVVTHWKQRTLESGEYVKSYMKVKDAIWLIKEGWLEKATIEIEE